MVYNMEICLNIPRVQDVILVVEDFDYDGGQPQTRHQPHCPASASVTKGYLKVDGDKNPTGVDKFINEILKTSGTILDRALEANKDLICEELLEHINDEAREVEDGLAEEMWEEREFLRSKPY
jgi:hypothetical protein